MQRYNWPVEDRGSIEFGLLGPLEIRAGRERLHVAGERQRALLALLLLHANRPVSSDTLIDEVWGERPPRSARHSLEVYVSRLRGVLQRAGDGAAIESRPPGYILRIPVDALDVHRMEKLVEAAREARDAGDLEHAHRLFTQALELWRGPSLADVSLSSGTVEAERLEEARLGASTERADVELALGRHGSLVQELAPLVRRHPFHERLCGQLMLGLYRSGRQAEALDVYQATRSELAAELGLQPGPELRELAARIIRQERSLEVPSSGSPAAAVPGPFPEQGQPQRRRGLLFAAIAVAAVAALGALVTGVRSNDRDSPSRAATPAAGAATYRVALAVSGGVGDVDDFPLTSEIAEGLERAVRAEGLEAETFDAGFDTDSFRSTLEGLTKGDFDLVVAFGAVMDQAIAQVAAGARDTHFILLDTSIEGGPLHGLDNVTGVAFAEHEAAYLAGYLAGLVEQEKGPRLNGEEIVSVVGGHPIPPVERYAAGFAAGARSALPGVEVIVDFARTWDDQERCADIARRQLEAGSDIVFPVAGACSFGALEVASIRGAWGIGVDGDLGYLGPHMLLSVVKRFDRATELAVKWFADGRLPRGRTVVFDLRNNGVGIAGIAPSVPAPVRARVAERAADIRAGTLVVPSSLSS